MAEGVDSSIYSEKKIPSNRGVVPGIKHEYLSIIRHIMINSFLDNIPFFSKICKHENAQ